MVSKAFKKELRGLSPYQLTMAVKEWMENHDSRINITFNWNTEDSDDISEEFKPEELLILKSIDEKPEKKKKKLDYVKL